MVTLRRSGGHVSVSSSREEGQLHAQKSLAFLAVTGLAAAALPAAAQQIRGTPGAPDAVAFPDSRELPMPWLPFTGQIMPNPIDSKPAWLPQVTPTEGTPNVLLILLDDAGYGSNSAFGSLITIPSLNRLAANGLHYTEFHTTSLCSPTGATLLTGRSHHRLGFGVVSEMSTGYDGYNAITPRKPRMAQRRCS